MKVHLKKSLSLFLSAVMLLSVTAGINFSAFASDKTPVSIEFVPVDDPVILYEGIDGYTQEDDAGVYFEYRLDYNKEGNTINVYYDDESMVAFTSSRYYYDEDSYSYEFVDSEGEILENVYTTDDQQEGHWGLGEHSFEIHWDSFSDTVDVICQKNPVNSIEVQLEKPLVTYENSNGQYESDYDDNEFFNYWISIYDVGNKLIAKTDEGDVVYTCRDEYNIEYGYYQTVFVNEDGEIADFFVSDNQFEEHWTVGTNYMTIEFMGRRAIVPVEILEAPVDFSVSVIEHTSSYENDENNGCWTLDDADEEYFEYYSPFLYSEDSVLTLTFKNGSKKLYTVDEIEESEGYFRSVFVDSNGNVLPSDVRFYDDQRENHWGIGTHYFTVEIAGVKKQIAYEVLEKPIDVEFEFADKNATVLKENVNGYYENEGEENEWFRYFTPYEKEEGNRLTLIFSDSSKNKTYTAVEKYDEERGFYDHYFVDENGERLDAEVWLDDAQSSDNCWSVGENYATLYVAGIEKQIPFTVLPSPVEMLIELPNGESITYFSESRGHRERDEQDEEFYFYDTDPSYFLTEGTKITFFYEDESSMEYVAVNRDYGSWNDVVFLNEDTGDTIERWDFEIYSDQYENHWDVGEHEFTIAYGKASTNLPVEIIENHVERIHFTPVSATVVENTNGEFDYRWDDEKEAEVKFFYYDLFGILIKVGTTLKIDYKDGTSETYTVKMTDLGGESEMPWFVNKDGEALQFQFLINDNQYHDPLKLGKNTIQVEYLGRFDDVELEVVSAIKDGWNTIDGKKYYYKNGSPLKGVQRIDNKTYVFAFADGRMLTNMWVSVSGKKYYVGKDGVALTYRKKIGNNYYYFNGAGVLQKGWIKGGVWMYGDLSTGALKIGWFKVGGKWYYFKTDGSMVSGWQKIGGKWYYFHATNGDMKTGWQKISGKWYYFNSSGAMVTGWQKIGGKWYYFESSGAMRTANLKQGGKTYRFNSSGACINP